MVGEFLPLSENVELVFIHSYFNNLDTLYWLQFADVSGKYCIEIKLANRTVRSFFFHRLSISCEVVAELC